MFFLPRFIETVAGLEKNQLGENSTENFQPLPGVVSLLTKNGKGFKLNLQVWGRYTSPTDGMENVPMWSTFHDSCDHRS